MKRELNYMSYLGILDIPLFAVLFFFSDGITPADNPFLTVWMAASVGGYIGLGEVFLYTSRLRDLLLDEVTREWRGDLSLLAWAYFAYRGNPTGYLTLTLAVLLTVHYVRLVYLRCTASDEVKQDAYEREAVVPSSQRIEANSANMSAENTTVATITNRTRRPSLSFDDIVGMEEVKAKLLSAGTEVMNKPSGKETRNGILLNGEPGNGKTMFAEALAGQLKLPYLPVSIGDVASKWVNQTTEQVVKVFADARAQAPCLLFIDEIDSLLKDRSRSTSSDSESDNVVNAILTELVNIRRHGVVVMAATNHLDRLDPAAIREGRFDFKIEIPAPDKAARIAILSNTLNKLLRPTASAQPQGSKWFSKKAPTTVQTSTAVAVDDSAVERAAGRWAGFSAARLTAIGKETPSTLKTLGSHVVTFEVLMQALRSVQGRAAQLPENTPTLDKLHMATSLSAQLLSLSNRMIHISQVEELGGRVPRGVLFYGVPGTGKTLTARALAKSTGWAFLEVSGTDLIREPTRIEKVMKTAADLRPCIVFIDEADEVLADRAYSHNAAVTNSLLTAMDGAGGQVRDVIFIAATNYPEKMDDAALRGGRFTEKVEFLVPEVTQIMAMVEQWKKNLSIPHEPAFDSNAIAVCLHGLAHADITAVLQAAIDQAASRRIIDNHAVLEMEDITSGRQVVGCE